MWCSGPGVVWLVEVVRCGVAWRGVVWSRVVWLVKVVEVVWCGWPPGVVGMHRTCRATHDGPASVVVGSGASLWRQDGTLPKCAEPFDTDESGVSGP